MAKKKTSAAKPGALQDQAKPKAAQKAKLEEAIPESVSPGVETPKPEPQNSYWQEVALAKTGTPEGTQPEAKSERTTKPRVARGAATRKPAYSQEDLALRAYFISEKRREQGLPGNEHLDWLEAERQLKAETSRQGRSK